MAGRLSWSVLPGPHSHTFTVPVEEALDCTDSSPASKLLSVVVAAAQWLSCISDYGLLCCRVKLPLAHHAGPGPSCS